ncbi:MAG: hypothetical protein AVDCRST_MAG60-259, partial [uncultured Nocardioides sp.]
GHPPLHLGPSSDARVRRGAPC